MKLPRNPFTNPDRMIEIGEHVDIDVVDLLARASDAGYSDEDAIAAVLTAAKVQAVVGFGIEILPDQNSRWI